MSNLGNVSNHTPETSGNPKPQCPYRSLPPEANLVREMVGCFFFLVGEDLGWVVSLYSSSLLQFVFTYLFLPFPFM
jgi:hypothetical protein